MTCHAHLQKLTPAVFLLGVVASVVGCGGGRVSPPIDASSIIGTPPILVPAPDASSPTAAVQYLRWAMNQRDWRRYSEILTDDFQFAFAATDSAGNSFRDRQFTRAEEVVVARNMFETGTPVLAPFIRVVVTLVAPLIASPDPRAGKDPSVHQLVRANLMISADGPVYSFRLSGAGYFYLVRGDSARIPQDLRDRGFRPDASRWWVERWEDETGGGSSAARGAAMPGRSPTWGAVKVLYY